MLFVLKLAFLWGFCLQDDQNLAFHYKGKPDEIHGIIQKAEFPKYYMRSNDCVESNM